MRLSWNEIRVRAAAFTEEWKDAHYEKGETQSFYNDFFEVFGVKRRRVASFEEPVKLLGAKRGFIDLFWKGVRAGLWDMTQSSWSSPNATPVTVTGLVAERQMIGPFLEEVVHPGAAASAAPFKRLDYLTFNRVEGRWDYASMDTRSSNGIMPAWSVGRDPADRIDLVFQPFAVVGSGLEVKGQMLRMEQIITQDGPDRDVKDQYFILADGVGTKWLAKRYTYTRRPS